MISRSSEDLAWHAADPAILLFRAHAPIKGSAYGEFRHVAGHQGKRRKPHPLHDRYMGRIWDPHAEFQDPLSIIRDWERILRAMYFAHLRLVGADFSEFRKARAGVRNDGANPPRQGDATSTGRHLAVNFPGSSPAIRRRLESFLGGCLWAARGNSPGNLQMEPPWKLQIPGKVAPSGRKGYPFAGSLGRFWRFILHRLCVWRSR